MLGLLATNPATASDLVGQASVIDGDTLDVQGTRIRLHGIDAPESSQLCYRDSKPSQCGREAANALGALLGRQHVRCEDKTRDRYGRMVGVCYLGGQDLNAWMVSQGWAMAYVLYSRDYAAMEQQAKTARLGIWATEFDAPWDWRKGKRSAGPTVQLVRSAAVGCSIKGNVNAKGERIYHMPGGAFYGKTMIEAAEGDQMFCSEGEARRAGFRRSQR